MGGRFRGKGNSKTLGRVRPCLYLHILTITGTITAFFAFSIRQVRKKLELQAEEVQEVASGNPVNL